MPNKNGANTVNRYGSISNSECDIINWKLDNPKNLFKKKKGAYILSPEIKDGQNKWFLKMYPLGYPTNNHDQNTMSIFLCLLQDKNNLKPIKVTYEVSILNNEDEPYITNKSNEDEEFNPGESELRDLPELTDFYDCLGWHYFYESQKILKELRNLTNDDGQLVIRCILKIINKKRRCDECELNDQQPASKRSAVVVNSEDNNDFESMINNKLIGDFKIKVKNTVYFVSKNILINNIDAFKEELTENSSKTEIEIKDFEPHAVLEMLRFIYLGKIKHANVIALDLYKLGEKYKINELKKIAEDVIIESLNRGNKTLKNEEIDIN